MTICINRNEGNGDIKEMIHRINNVLMINTLVFYCKYYKLYTWMIYKENFILCILYIFFLADIWSLNEHKKIILCTGNYLVTPNLEKWNIKYEYFSLMYLLEYNSPWNALHIPFCSLVINSKKMMISINEYSST